VRPNRAAVAFRRFSGNFGESVGAVTENDTV
jgi:hypothetical protein